MKPLTALFLVMGIVAVLIAGLAVFISILRGKKMNFNKRHHID